MNAMQNNRLHLHGALRAGKSYLLARLVSQLKREGMRVVYLPDCYELLLCDACPVFTTLVIFCLLPGPSLRGSMLSLALRRGVHGRTWNGG